MRPDLSSRLNHASGSRRGPLVSALRRKSTRHVGKTDRVFESLGDLVDLADGPYPAFAAVNLDEQAVERLDGGEPSVRDGRVEDEPEEVGRNRDRGDERREGLLDRLPAIMGGRTRVSSLPLRRRVSLRDVPSGRLPGVRSRGCARGDPEARPRQRLNRAGRCRESHRGWPAAWTMTEGPTIRGRALSQ